MSTKQLVCGCYARAAMRQQIIRMMVWCTVIRFLYPARAMSADMTWGQAMKLLWLHRRRSKKTHFSSEE